MKDLKQRGIEGWISVLLSLARFHEDLLSLARFREDLPSMSGRVSEDEGADERDN